MSAKKDNSDKADAASLQKGASGVKAEHLELERALIETFSLTRTGSTLGTAKYRALPIVIKSGPKPKAGKRRGRER